MTLVFVPVVSISAAIHLAFLSQYLQFSTPDNTTYIQAGKNNDRYHTVVNRTVTARLCSRGLVTVTGELAMFPLGNCL